MILGGLKAGDKVIIDNLIKAQARHAGQAAHRARRRLAATKPAADGERAKPWPDFYQPADFASVISIIIVIAGLVAMQVLPIAQYPQIAPAHRGDHRHLSGRLGRNPVQDGGRAD